MPGRYGNEKATVKGLSVAKIDNDNNILVINGSVPGPNGSTLRIEIQK
jgi:large subunit ribosomal protein L3